MTSPPAGHSTAIVAGMGAPTLQLRWARGHRAYLPAPAPDLAVLTLPLLTSLAMREWIVVTADHELSVCGHDYTVAGWSRAPLGLVVEHACVDCTARVCEW